MKADIASKSARHNPGAFDRSFVSRVIEKLWPIAESGHSLPQFCKRFLNGGQIGAAAQALFGVPSSFRGTKEPKRGSWHQISP